MKWHYANFIMPLDTDAIASSILEVFQHQFVPISDLDWVLPHIQSPTNSAKDP